MTDLKAHWEAVYSDPTKVKHTWTQAVPDRTLLLLSRMAVDKSLPIIDIGGGDSQLVDHLLNAGYSNITVLDISEHAIERSKARLGLRAQDVTWIVSNILEFEPSDQYAIWIDRATFHFLQTPGEIERYYHVIEKSIAKNGSLIISTFSEVGPSSCSGLPVKRYSKYELTDVFKSHFDRKHTILEDHKTPANTLQQFIYCWFQRRNDGEMANHSIEKDELFLSDLSVDSEGEANSCGIDQRGCCG
jgi:2-polyprenyl-3-methyl-5-hydroxy-6-metoxy-1,4-benzoquinol methylase